ncbi:MAG: hypothetical protein ACPG7F_00415 [Aggregatilineales bacterium]
MADSLISINTDGQFSQQTERLKQRLSQTGLNRLYFRIAQKVGVTAEFHIADPPVRRSRPLPLVYRRTLKSGKTVMSKFKSMKQQGKMFALLKEGAIPYTRGQGTSERLLQSMTSSVRQQGDTFNVIVGSDASYGALVKDDEDEQSPIHKGVWSPLSEDVGSDTAQADYERVIATELTAFVNGLFGE